MRRWSASTCSCALTLNLNLLPDQTCSYLISNRGWPDCLRGPCLRCAPWARLLVRVCCLYWLQQRHGRKHKQKVVKVGLKFVTCYCSTVCYHERGCLGMRVWPSPLVSMHSKRPKSCIRQHLLQWNPVISLLSPLTSAVMSVSCTTQLASVTRAATRWGCRLSLLRKRSCSYSRTVSGKRAMPTQSLQAQGGGA